MIVLILKTPYILSEKSGFYCGTTLLNIPAVILHLAVDHAGG